MWEEKKSKSIVIIVQNKKLFSIITVNRLKMEERNKGKKKRDTNLSFGKKNKKLLSIIMFNPSGKKKDPSLSFNKIRSCFQLPQ